MLLQEGAFVSRRISLGNGAINESIQVLQHDKYYEADGSYSIHFVSHIRPIYTIKRLASYKTTKHTLAHTYRPLTMLLHPLVYASPSRMTS